MFSLRESFFPSPQNDYTPPVLQQMAMGVMTLMVLLTFALANFQSLLWWSSDWLVGTVLPSVIVDLTNEERSDDALVTLRRNDVLDEAARKKAEHMAAEGYFAHFSPDGVSPWYWFREVEYPFVHAGENLAVHFTDSGEVVDAWMDSPTHRANIMNGNFTEIGVGTAKGTYEGYETVFVVQMFGTPALAQQPEPEPEPVLATEVIPAAEISTTTATNTPVTLVAAAETDSTPSDFGDVTPTNIDPLVSGATDSLPLEAEVSTATMGVPTEIVDLVTTVDRVSMYSDTVSSSTGLAPATMSPLDDLTTSESSLVGKLLTQSHWWLQYIYASLAVFVVLSLLVSILVEIRHQRPMQVTYACLLLVLMSGLYYFHVNMTAGAIVI